MDMMRLFNYSSNETLSTIAFPCWVCYDRLPACSVLVKGSKIWSINLMTFCEEVFISLRRNVLRLLQGVFSFRCEGSPLCHKLLPGKASHLRSRDDWTFVFLLRLRSRNFIFWVTSTLWWDVLLILLDDGQNFSCTRKFGNFDALVFSESSRHLAMVTGNEAP